MANKLSIAILCLALVVVHAIAARQMPSDKGLADQKNVYEGAGGIGGIGSNGLPYGGVISGVGRNVGGIGGGAGFDSIGGLGGGLGGVGGLGGAFVGDTGAGAGFGAGNLPLR